MGGIAIALIAVVTATAFTAAAVVGVGVQKTLLLGKNEDGPPLLRRQSKLVETAARIGVGVAVGAAIVRLLCVCVVIDGDGFFGRVGPSKLDGASLRAAGMIAQDLCVGPNLTVSKGNVVMAMMIIVVMVTMIIVVTATVHGGFATGERRGGRKGFLAASAAGSFRFLFAVHHHRHVHHLSIAVIAIGIAAAAAVDIGIGIASTSMGKMELQQEVVDVWQ